MRTTTMKTLGFAAALLFAAGVPAATPKLPAAEIVSRNAAT